MKLSRRSMLWIIIVLFLGTLTGSLMIYTDYNKKVNEYDTELLKSGPDDEVQPAKDHDEIIPDTDTSGQDPVPDEPPDTNVTVDGSYGEELVVEGSKNILILGEDDQSKLYDTIGIISVDSPNKKVSIIMLPRDMYVDYSKSVRDAIQAAGKAKVSGMYKLNAAHYVGAIVGYKGKFDANSISFLAQVIKEKFNVDVDDYIKVNTRGFRQIVDLYGGVVINVPYDMNYKDNQGLIIDLKKGKQTLDGKKAEGFVRFRQGYKEDGTKFDVDRKINQIVFLKAFIKQHGTIAKINRIPSLLKTLDRNIMHSIDLGDVLLSYIGLAKDIINDKYVIEDKNINGKNRIINGEFYVIIE